MCDFSKGFRLCTCAPEALDKEPYTWALYRRKGERSDKIMGKFRLPVEDLGSGLASDFVQQQLNSQACFDFDYQPQEGDNLVFRETGNIQRMEFLFKEGKWQKGYYSPFRYIKEQVEGGKIV